MSTKTDLADEEIVRIFGTRWDIEVFFKMMKHYLNLERATQLHDFDGIIGHITVVTSLAVKILQTGLPKMHSNSLIKAS